MRIHILSDLHLEHGSFEMPGVESDVLVLAGDILSPGNRAIAWAARDHIKQGRLVIQVAGNHEYYDRKYQSERNEMRSTADRMGIHLLHGHAVVIAGVRFLGCTLWTDYALPILDGDTLRSGPAKAMKECLWYMNDYKSIKWQPDAGTAQLLKPLHLRGEHQAERAWLAQQLAEPFDGPTVVVTHHAPHPGSIRPGREEEWATAAYASALPAEFFEVPVLWIHGHTHTPFDYRVGNCRVVCNPRGYRRPDSSFEVEAFNPCFTVEV